MNETKKLFLTTINNLNMEKMNIKQVRLSGTEGSGYNQFAQIIGENDKYYQVSLQVVETLERHTRCFSKKTLKCVSNGSDFTNRCKIIK